MYDQLKSFKKHSNGQLLKHGVSTWRVRNKQQWLQTSFLLWDDLVRLKCSLLLSDRWAGPHGVDISGFWWSEPERMRCWPTETERKLSGREGVGVLYLGPTAKVGYFWPHTLGSIRVSRSSPQEAKSLICSLYNVTTLKFFFVFCRAAAKGFSWSSNINHVCFKELKALTLNIVVDLTQILIFDHDFLLGKGRVIGT